jgi:putative transposase
MADANAPRRIITPPNISTRPHPRCTEAMSRLPRYAPPGQPLHVIQRGVNRSPLFQVHDNYRFFRSCVASAFAEHACLLHAYVLMTNHVHLLVTPAGERAMAKAMQAIGRRYVPYFNTMFARTGPLFEGRYRASPIDSERYLFTCYRYVELNPVRAGLVSDPTDYRWSSHRYNALGIPDPLVTPSSAYEALGATHVDRQDAYRALAREHLDDSTLGRIRTAAHRGAALGDDEFRAAVARRGGQIADGVSRIRTTVPPSAGRNRRPAPLAASGGTGPRRTFASGER